MIQFQQPEKNNNNYNNNKNNKCLLFDARLLKDAAARSRFVHSGCSFIVNNFSQW